MGGGARCTREDGCALLSGAAKQGHVYAMFTLGELCDQDEEYEEAVKWYTMAAENGMPKAMYNLGVRLYTGEGVASDPTTAAMWFERAAAHGSVDSMRQLASMFTIGNGVERSKKFVVAWNRNAADAGSVAAANWLAMAMYLDLPYARRLGKVIALEPSQALRAKHGALPKRVLASVIWWLQPQEPIVRTVSPSIPRMEETDERTRLLSIDPDATLLISSALDMLYENAHAGTRFCHNIGCGVIGPLKAFKVCPQCKTARYCGPECQKHDWNAGEHKRTCGTWEQATHIFQGPIY
jgi:TPR repeat protein